ncbi:MAG: uroporphyrinogen-III synthase [Alphaproteobacteria bacterium]|nr:uroporphyrinogen-III synthase [Alphaproteobacteria bacterium]
MRILLTRPRDESEELAAQLAGLGHQPVLSPVLDIGALDPSPPPSPFSAGIAASPRALIYAASQHIQMLRGKPLFLVGKRTEAAARVRGLTQICCATQTAALLADAILANPPAGPLLYLAGRDRKPLLEDALRAAGLPFSVLEIYEARAASALTPEAVSALRSNSINAVLHFSRRSAEIFATLATHAGLEGQAAAALHICISADAATGLALLQTENIQIASAPAAQAMIDALEATG